MKTLTMAQGSSEWLMARCGVVTASEADNLITPERKPRAGQTRQSYLNTKIAEKLLGYVEQTGASWAMDQGAMIEKLAIPFFEFTQNVTVERVGFCVSDDGRIGCSPDGLIGADGGLECKAPLPHTHVGYLLAGEVPPQYRAQIHFSMLVTGRKWWDFMSYQKSMPPLIVHVDRDEAWQAALWAVLTPFLADFDAALAKITAMMPKGER